MAERITITGPIPSCGVDLLSSTGDVWMWEHDTPIPREVRRHELSTADAAMTMLSDRVDEEFLSEAPHLRIVANVAVGYNNIDVAACHRANVVVTNTPGVLTDATADLAMGLILMVTRRLGEGERHIRSGAPWKWSMFMMLGMGLQGRTLGIVGMGDIGRALARRARAFGLDIMYHNRRPVAPDVEEVTGARWVPLDELLERSDVVSLHCPYTDDTHHLISADELTTMKPSAYLVNTARGPIVDESALVDALQTGRIAGAALDVFEHEPEVHPGLVELEQAVIVPHLGSATVATRDAMAELAARNVVEVLAGRPPVTPVIP